MSMQRINFKSKNDYVLYGNAWPIDDAIANVIIVTGMKETSSRYDDFAKFLNKNKLNVYCIDHFGQGENVIADKGCLGLWPKSGFRKFVNVLDELVARLRLTCVPTYIVAHSMGSFVVQDYIQRYTKHISRVVLVGTSGPIPFTRLGYDIARLITTKKTRNNKSPFLDRLVLGNVNKKINHFEKMHAIEEANGRDVEFNKRKPGPADWLSYDKESNNKYLDNPLCGGIYSRGFYLDFLKGLTRLWQRRFLKKIRKDLSIFIAAGAEDPIGGYGKRVLKLEKIYRKLGLKDVETKIYPHMRHEILNEVNKEQVYEDIVSFLLKDVKTDNAILDKQDRTMDV